MSDPVSSFTAYVDESGCSGGRFGQGSSDFLVMGAVVVRDDFLPEVMGIFDAARADRGRDNQFRKFSKESDKNRFLLTSHLGRAKVQTCFVALHKPSLDGSYIRDHHANEYNYLLKMLLERISWIVRDAPVRQGRVNGPCRLVLSEQTMYPYDALYGYVWRLRLGGHNCSVEWNHIVDAPPVIVAHENEQAIHLADIAASSFAMALEPKVHGMTDDRFIRNLRSTIYRRWNRLFGVKIFPSAAVPKLRAKGMLEFIQLL